MINPINKSNENQKSKIPKTGRIGRLARNIEQETNRAILLKVMQDVEQFQSASDKTMKAAWLKGAIERLEKLVDKETAVKIMESCGLECCSSAVRKRAKQLISKSQSIGEFLNKFSAGGYRFNLKDNNTIIGTYNKCYCGQVKHTKETFLTNTYCQCGVGYLRQLFESALDKPVKVELIQSIITGAERCEFIISI
ncbi:hypothetical protein CEE39_09930 [bacterium (candidate division B38) B3_B38]|nr:MAG: hypothetical protein CEE39_09930 [bacterium (candidate division B38) B3_B38]